MAEIALIASIVQIADVGYRLSLKLYTTGEAISSADRAIVTISKDISLTSTVLKELGHILGRDEDEKERICSDNLVQTAGDTVKECLEVFEELDKMILKNMPNLSQGNRATRATMAMERLKWPFIQPRIQLLKGSLDMLRANISLMLNVLIYARHKSERKKLRTPAPDVYDEASQKTIIEELVNAKEEYVRKFETLKLSIPTRPSTQQVHKIGSRAAPAQEGNVVPTEHTFNTVSATTTRNAPAPQPPFDPSSMSTFQSAPASQYTFNPVSATAFQKTPASPHTFNPLSRSTPQNAPASPYTFTHFSASTFQKASAPQWPLPNVPASYPVVSGDTVTFQSDQHNPWELLAHFDILVRTLVQEVYSPGYQIPAESRSRFTSAIRETHKLEAVEAQRREPSKSGMYAEAHHISPIPHGRQSLSLNQPYMSYLRCKSYETPASSRCIYSPETPSYGYPYNSPGSEPLRFGQRAAPERRGERRGRRHSKGLSAPGPTVLRTEQGRNEEQPAIKRSKRDTEEVSDISEPAYCDYYLDDVEEAPEPPRVDVPWLSAPLDNELQAPEPPRVDVVDDLLKLWTIVR